MARLTRTIALPLVLLTASLAAQAYTDAYARATVLGRANGAAIACNAPSAEREKFVDLAKAELQRLAPNSSDLSDATTRMAIETAKARRAVESGSIGCPDALEFYKDQLKSLRRAKR